VDQCKAAEVDQFVTGANPGRRQDLQAAVIGRWEDDVLIVDTVGFESGILSADGRLPHSDRLHVVERFSLDAGGRALTRRWTAEDPLYFEGQYAGSDVVYVSDVSYQPTPCEGLSDEPQADETDPGARWILWSAAGLAALAVGAW
jgi:hypothetical protein